MSQWRLLLTRPAEDCAALAQSLAAAGVGSSCLPLLAIEPIIVQAPQRRSLEGLHDFQAIIVVSKPAARLLLEHLAESSIQPPQRGWFTVGEATAGVLQGAGLEVSSPPRGDDSEAVLALPAYPAGTLMRRIEAERLNGLVVSSGQGFEHLQQMAGADWLRLAQLPLFVPSPRVAEQAKAAGAQQVVDCRGASATALLAAVQRSAAPAS